MATGAAPFRVVVVFVPVIFPVKWLKVLESISSTLRNGHNVVYLPPVLGHLSKRTPRHTGTADIFAEGFVPRFRLPFSPDQFHDVGRKRCACCCRVSLPILVSAGPFA